MKHDERLCEIETMTTSFYLIILGDELKYSELVFELTQLARCETEYRTKIDDPIALLYFMNWRHWASIIALKLDFYF